MPKLTKRRKLFKELTDSSKAYSISEALDILKQVSEKLSSKFKESIDVSVNLGIDAKKSDQVVRGATVLPNGNGKTVCVAVFAEGEQAKAAEAAGADVVGFDDLLASMKGGNLDYDVVIATPDAMRLVGQLGPVLGPRGLMPNPKVGTVTPDVAKAVSNAKSGQVRYRNDKAGIVHCSIGNMDFASDAIKSNLEALIADLKKAKPTSAKGVYLKKVSLSSTKGPGLQLDLASIEV